MGGLMRFRHAFLSTIFMAIYFTILLSILYTLVERRDAVIISYIENRGFTYSFFNGKWVG